VTATGNAAAVCTGGGTAASSCVADVATNVSLAASTNAGFRFTGWTGANGACTGTTTPLSIAAVAGTTITCTANYVARSTVGAIVNAAQTAGGNVTATGDTNAVCTGGGTAASSCVADAATNVSLAVATNANFRFTGWTGANPACTGTTTPLSIAAVAGTTITCTANFVGRATVGAVVNAAQTASGTAMQTRCANSPGQPQRIASPISERSSP